MWEIDRPGSSAGAANTSQPVVLPGTSLLLTKGYGLGAERVQFQAGEMQRLWKNTAVLKTKLTNAVYQNAYAFALSDGRLECIDLRNGRRVWKSRKSYGHGQVLLCGSELLVLSEKGFVCLVRAWGLPKNRIPSASTYSSPASRQSKGLHGIRWPCMGTSCLFEIPKKLLVTKCQSGLPKPTIDLAVHV